MYYISNAYILVKTSSSALAKVFLWSTTDDKASWTVNGRQRHQEGTKPASAKITNCSYPILLV